MQIDWGPKLKPGVCVGLAPLVRRILAPNPSALTGPGTNTYLVGRGEVSVIDPGPGDRAHLAALLAALSPGEKITRILVTHPHLDHTRLVPTLKQATGAGVFAWGTASQGRNPAYATLGDLGGGEGCDDSFTPDYFLKDGDFVKGEGWQLEVLHTPGHLGSHISFVMGDAIFCGDQAMGWATSVVSPPDGDMSAYMASLDRLIGRAPQRLWPGHGEEVSPALPRLEELRRHRLARETQILEALKDAPGTASALAARIYTEIAPSLLPAASRNVLAHLLDLRLRDQVHAESEVSAQASWSL